MNGPAYTVTHVGPAHPVHGFSALVWGERVGYRRVGWAPTRAAAKRLAADWIAETSATLEATPGGRPGVALTED